MKIIIRLLIPTIASLCSFSCFAEHPKFLLLEWSDLVPQYKNQPKDEIPVSLYTLTCNTASEQSSCELGIITIGRKFCPAVLNVDSYRTGDGALTVHLGKDNVEIEIQTPFARLSTHLALATVDNKDKDIDPMQYVDEESGAVVIRNGKISSMDIIPIVKGTTNMIGREYATLTLKCPSINVVASKHNAK